MSGSRSSATSEKAGIHRRGSHRDDRGIVAAPPMVAEDHAGDERWMACRKAGIGVDLPSRRKAVGMQDHQRPAGERIGELANTRRHMPGRAVIGGHPASLAAGCQYCADVADPDKAHHLRVRINARNRQRGAPRRRKRAMDRFDQRNAFLVDVVGKCPRRGFGGVRRMGPVAGAVDKQQGGAPSGRSR